MTRQFGLTTARANPRSLVQFHFSHLLWGTTLLCLTLVIVGEEAWTYIAVAALFAAFFSITSTARSRAWNGAKGAIVGWGVAMALGLTIDTAGYWSQTGSNPYFEDGIIWGLIGAPIYAASFFSIPLAAMGFAIGWGTSWVAKLIDLICCAADWFNNS